MDSKPKLLSSSREMRNIAEKMRRDKLNSYVSELASIVPLVCGSSKRIDKTSVLRLAANYIRLHNIVGDEEKKKEPTAATPSPVHKALLNALEEVIGGFLLVMTSSGKVVFITESVESHFGHTQVDLLGNSIYNVIHPEDHDIVKEHLDTTKDDTRKSFFCRMMEKALSRNDPSRYEIIHVVGNLKPLPECSSSSLPTNISKYQSESADSDSEDEESQPEHRPSRIGTHMLVSFVRVIKDRPITELSLVEATQEEYITRHTMDGKILYTDHRISFVTGLMPIEVVGTSAFQYMHPEDMVWSMVAHQLMFTSSQGQGLVSYRLKCKGGTLVTLRSRGYIELNKQTGQAETFVCINTVVSTKEAKNEIKNQRRKLLPMIVCQQSEDHLGSVSSSMPQELLSMMKQLTDPRTLHKMIAEVDPTFSLPTLMESLLPQNSDLFKNNHESSLEPRSDVSKDAYQECEHSKLASVNCTDDSFQIVKENELKGKQSLNESRKRNSKADECGPSAKMPNQNLACKPKADLYHQSYSPQDSVLLPNLSPNTIPLPNLSPDTIHLPNLSPDSVHPILCSSPVSLESSSCSQQNKFHAGMMNMTNSLEVNPNNYSTHSHGKHEFEGAEANSNLPSVSCSFHSNSNCQDCRQCSKRNLDPCKYFVSHNQGNVLNSHFKDISYQQPPRNVKSADAYYHNTAENANASKCPPTVSNQHQVYPQCIGSNNGVIQDVRSSHLPACQQMPYPHASYLSASVPEFSNNLQTHHHYHGHHFHQSPHLHQESHPPQQRIHVQQHVYSNSSPASQPSVLGMTSETTNPETLYSIPTQCMPSSIQSPGMYGPSSIPVVPDRNIFHPYGVKVNEKIMDPYSDHHF